jgi:hypothetical protein
MTWREAVLTALHRLAIRENRLNIDRQKLISEELEQIIKDTNSLGVTPTQTLSRVLQELREEKIIHFISNGNYLLADAVINVESEDLPDDALDFAIQNNRLALGILPASDQLALTRQRKGQQRIRLATLENYQRQCAFCDVKDNDLLIASHISRWADEPEHRGNLANLICMCHFHDVLFEKGYFTLSDNYEILKRKNVTSKTVLMLLKQMDKLRLPQTYNPASLFLHKHRLRTGF